MKAIEKKGSHPGSWDKSVLCEKEGKRQWELGEDLLIWILSWAGLLPSELVTSITNPHCLIWKLASASIPLAALHRFASIFHCLRSTGCFYLFLNKQLLNALFLKEGK